MKKKLLIFDLDGTLLNTLKDLQNAVNYALKKYHYETRDIEFIRKAVGNGVKKLVERSLINGLNNPDFDMVFATFNEFYQKHSSDHTKRYPFMLKTLQNLKKKGYILAVCTNKIDKVAHELVEFHYPHIFDMVQGDVPSLKKKPDPEMIFHIIETYNLNKDEVTYIGDTNIDHDVAYNADIDLVLVSYGYRTYEELLEYKYKNAVIIHSPQSLLEIF